MVDAKKINNIYFVHTHSPEETRAFAQKLAQKLAAGDVITLDGELGTGKTHFAQGIAAGLGIKGVVNSPTYTIVKEYQGRLPFYHLDVYRLEDGGADELELDQYFFGSGVTLVEWSALIEHELPEHYLAVVLKREGETRREIQLTPVGEHYCRLLEGILG
mgnify:CR=1 FL=1|jgi:tRNA threonylcarbamoyladenosine biosynthesis protein TsaE